MWCFYVIHERKSLRSLCIALLLLWLLLLFEEEEERDGYYVSFSLIKKNYLNRIAPSINNIVFKKLILHFFNHCVTISFVTFATMVLLQILKSVKKSLV